MSRASSPDVVVAVVTWNSATVIPGLMEALPRAMEGVDGWRLVVADNDSTDGTRQLVARLAPASTVLAMGRNLGFAAGVNVAIAACPRARAALVLNPDVRPAPGSARLLLDALAVPGTGIAVPRLVGEDGRLHHSLRREPTVLRTLGQAVLGRRAGRIGRLGEVVADPARYERPGTADWATGAMMMISRACLDAVGPWDESFFMYSEETDFALRARDLGLATRYEPAAVGLHLKADSEYSQRLWTILTLNRVRLFHRRNGAIRSAAFRSAVVLNEGMRGLLPGRPHHRAALRALLWPSERPSEVAP